VIDLNTVLSGPLSLINNVVTENLFIQSCFVTVSLLALNHSSSLVAIKQDTVCVPANLDAHNGINIVCF